jgi:hypothetical protein
MGQVPKNNIIMAKTGTTLTFMVDGVRKDINENDADAQAAQERDRLIQVGELRDDEGQAYMDSWTKLKEKSRTGAYAIDTAGKDAIAGIKYSGTETPFGTIVDKNGKTVAAQGSHFRDKFTKKIKRGDVSQMEAVVSRSMFPKLGGLSLTDDEKVATEAKIDEDALKVKTDAETLKAKTDAEKLDLERRTVQTPEAFISKQFGGVKGTESFGRLGIPERQAFMRPYFENMLTNFDQYDATKGQDLSWMTPFKNKETGAFEHSPLSYRALLAHTQGDTGTTFGDLMFGTTPAAGTTVLTPEQKVAADKKEAVRSQEEKLKWNDMSAQPGMIKVSDNIVQSKIDPTKILHSDKTKRFRPGMRYDPTTNTRYQQLMGYPVEGQVGTPGDLPTYELREDEKEPGKYYYVNTRNPKDIVRVEDFSDLSGEESIPDFQRLYGKHKEGGVIIAQEGWKAAPVDEEMGRSKANTTKSTSTTGTTSSGSSAKGVVDSATKKSKNLTQLKNEKWTTEDDLDLAAIGADIFGAAATFVPVYGNIAGAVSGMGATALGAIADARRDPEGFGWMDAAKTAGSLGLDALTLIPGVGTLAKEAKIVKHLPKIHRLLLAAGLGEQALAIGRMIDKGEVNTEDLRMAAGGLRLLSGMKGIGKLKRATEVGPPTGPTEVRALNTKLNTVERVPAEYNPTSKVWELKTPNADLQIKPGTKTNIFGVEKELPIGGGEQVHIKPEYGYPETIKGSLKSDSRLAREVSYKKELEGKGLTQPVKPKSVVDADIAAKQKIADDLKLKETNDLKLKEAADLKLKEAADLKAKAIVDAAIAKKNAPKKPRVIKKVEETPKKETLTGDIKKAAEIKAAQVANAKREQLDKLVAQIKKAEEEKKALLAVAPKVVNKKVSAGVKGRAAVEEPTIKTEPKKRLGRPPVERQMMLNGGRIPMGQAGWISEFAKNNLLGTNTLTNAVAPKLNFSKIDTFMRPNSTVKPLTTSNFEQSLEAWKTSGADPLGEGVPQPRAKGKTIGEVLGQMGQNEKQNLDLSEFGRTMYLNKVLGEKQNPLYIPAVVDKAETRTAVAGDLLSKQNQYNRAAQMMSASTNSKSSDPIRNFIQNLATNAQAEQLRSQADSEYSQGLERSRGMQAQLTDQAAGERKQTADQRAMYFTKAKAAKDEADWATKVGKASNLNTYWASKNLDKKQEIAQKEGGIKAFELGQKKAAIESKPEYAGIVSKYYNSQTGITNPAFKDLFDKYSKELADAERQIYYQKDGGTAKYKHEMDMYKDEYKSKKDIASALNRWSAHQADRVSRSSSQASKELNDLVSKIFTK